MSEVKKPVLLDANLADEKILHPGKGSLKLQMDGVDEVTLTLEDRAETIPMHRWVKIWNGLGFVGYFRRTSRGRNIGTENSYTLRHGIDILQDSIWDAETTFNGTKTQFLTALLDKQTHLIQGPGDSSPRKPWVLGSCADTSTVKKDIKYDNLMDLFEEMTEEGGGYYFAYNQSVWPWQVSLVAKPSDAESEFRLNRNMDRCQIKDNDSEMCTRLILNVNQQVADTNLSQLTGDGTNVTQNASVFRTYNNTTAQAAYGVIVKTADIDTTGDTFPSGPFPEADAWAADFLARRAEPLLQVDIDGEVLKGITGDSWDESKIGTMCRVSLPDYATAITERCVTVTYPDLYAAPERVTVSLANALPTFTRSMRETQKTVKKQGRSGRSASRQAESFSQHFQITDKAGNVLKQAGLHLDANGMLVYADDNVNMVGSRFNVQADQIGMVVGTNQDGNYIKGGEIALSINGQTGASKILLSADIIDIQGVVNELVTYDIVVNNLNVLGHTEIVGYLDVTDRIGSTGTIQGLTGDFTNLEADDAKIDSLKVYDSSSNSYVTASWQSYTARYVETSSLWYFLRAATDSTTPTGTTLGRVITGSRNTTIHYLGKAST